MEPKTIHAALQMARTEELIALQGWVSNRRIGKKMTFIALQDGSTQEPLQVAAETASLAKEFLEALHIGSSIGVEGKLVASPGRGQSHELQAAALWLIGTAPLDYPLQPKAHSLTFLRRLSHLRFRTRTFRAIFKIRHLAAHAIHDFFHSHGFSWIHTPILTDIDAEGAGATFQVSRSGASGGAPFFGGAAHLTVSGQLALEAAALGMGKVYTFGPTFRAEDSNTTRHLAEFWMIEPEMPFYDLPATIALAEEFLKTIVGKVCTQAADELDFLSRHEATRHPERPKEARLRAALESFQETPFQRLTYSEALTILQEEVDRKPRRFVHPVAPWGVDLQKEHENYLTDHFGKALVLTDYPKALKPFYMRQNEDGKTVAAMDILLPRVGELIGGSQREERCAFLAAAMRHQGVDETKMNWYLDTRRYGSVPHSGFGLGFERLLQFLTGMDNIRDVIPYPRTPGSIRY